MRKRFPKITKLVCITIIIYEINIINVIKYYTTFYDSQIKDGNDLPPQIGFDIADEGSLPPSAASFLCNSEGQTIVRQFLEQYFALYDKESRQPLLDAYHEQALFSLTASYSCGQQPSSSYNRYLIYKI